MTSKITIDTHEIEILSISKRGCNLRGIPIRDPRYAEDHVLVMRIDGGAERITSVVELKDAARYLQGMNDDYDTVLFYQKLVAALPKWLQKTAMSRKEIAAIKSNTRRVLRALRANA